MPFVKGQSGNKAGKPKGAVNKNTANLRNWITGFIDKNKGKIEEDWVKLDPKDRLIMFERLLKYTLPTLQAASIDIDFEKLSDEQLNEIIERLKSGK